MNGYDERLPPTLNYHYGIPSTGGKRAYKEGGPYFSVMFRKGTVCGLSPRMRLI